MSRKHAVVVTTVILAIIVVFVWLVDWGLVWQALQTADLRWLLVSGLGMWGGMAAYAVRWRLLLGGVPPLGFTFHASNVGHALNIWLPARAGEALRILLMGQRDDSSYTRAGTSFVIERAFEQLMRLFAFGGAVVYGLSGAVSSSSFVGGIAFLLLLFGGMAWLLNHQATAVAKGSRLLAHLPRITQESAQAWLSDLLTSLATVAGLRPFLLVLGWSLITWAFGAMVHYATLRALGDAFPPERWLALTFATLALSPPSAPTQPGLYHAIVVAPLTAVVHAPEYLTAYAILLHLQQMVWMTIGAGIGAYRLRLSPRLIWRNLRREG